MGVINNTFTKAGWNILALANAIAKYRSQRNEEGKNKAKQSYNTVATIKKQNNELTKNQKETPKSYFSDNLNIPPEIDEQKIAEQTVLKEMAQEKAKATSSGELPTVSTENSETKIQVDEDVKKLQEVKANIEKRNIPETAKVEEPTEDRLDWHNYADKFYKGIGYEAAEEKVKEKYGKTVDELYDENTPIKEKLEQLKSIIDLEKYRPTEEETGHYYYQNVVWDRLYKDYPEYKELEKQIGEKTDIANEAFRMRAKLARDSNSLTLEDFGFSKEEQDELAELNKKSLNKKSKNYARWDELEKKRVHAAAVKKNVINSYYNEKEAQEFNDKSEKLYKVWETKSKPKFNEYRDKKLPTKVQEAYDRIDNKNLTSDTWQDDLNTLNTYFQKQVMKKNKKEKN